MPSMLDSAITECNVQGCIKLQLKPGMVCTTLQIQERKVMTLALEAHITTFTLSGTDALWLAAAFLLPCCLTCLPATAT